MLQQKSMFDLICNEYMVLGKPETELCLGKLFLFSFCWANKSFSEKLSLPSTSRHHLFKNSNTKSILPNILGLLSTKQVKYEPRKYYTS